MGDEFPLLGALGLYASDVKGDGNCLFNALSDQLYGDQTQHHAIRTKTTKYMRENSDHFKQFIDVQPGGGTRRNPKRKNASTFSTPSGTVPPSAADIDRSFETHLQTMSKGGTWGDNLEVSAFASAFGVNVKIYQYSYVYVVAGEGSDNGKVLHIAYHTWEHYSSIRNIDGPHSGLPNVQPRALSEEEELKQKEKLVQFPRIDPKMIENVQKVLPSLVDCTTIKKTLEQYKGNFNEAVSQLLDMEDRGSASSTQGSSSVEREPDSEDEIYNAPNKKQNRRTSCAAGSSILRLRRSPNWKEPVRPSQESFGSDLSEQSLATDVTSIKADQEGMEVKMEQGDEEWKPENTTSRASSSEASVRPRIRITIDGRGSSSSPHRKRSSPTGINRKAAGRTQQKQVGPQHRRMPTAAQRKDIKKQAQKAARKERAMAESKAKANTSVKRDALPIYVKDPPHRPIIESGIKTLYI